MQKQHRVHALFVFLTLIFVAGEGWAQGSPSVTLVGNLNPSGRGPYAGNWGYVAPDGREYVITGARHGTQFVDITNPDSIREVAFVPGPTSTWREMRTWKHYAYVVTEAGGGTQIIDMSALPNSVTLVSSFTHTSGSKNTAKAHTIGIYDGYMYLNGCANWSPGGIVIFSLANPTAPQYVGEYSQRYIHDSHVHNDTIYAAAIYSGGGIDIINATNKSNPQLIARIQYPGSGTHNTWTTTDGRYVISTDETGSTQKNLKFWNLQNLPTPPSSPTATYTVNPSDIVHNVTVRGKFAYVAWYTAGLVIVNIQNPAIPQFAGQYDTYPGPSGGYNGAWAVYPYFPSGKIAISDMQTGTWVFRFADLAPRTRSPLLYPVDSSIVASSSILTFRWRAAARQEDDPHYYRLRVFGSGLDTLFQTRDTTLSVSATGLFQEGQSYNWHVWIMDGHTQVSSQDTFQFLVMNNTPRILTEPNLLEFGTVRIDSSVSLSVMITNIGSGALIIDSITTSTNAFQTIFVSPLVVPPDSSHTLSIAFIPTDTIMYEGTLHIFSNSFQAPEVTIVLRGIGDVLTSTGEYSLPSSRIQVGTELSQPL